MSEDLFGPTLPPLRPEKIAPGTPLADRMRPRSFDELLGQNELFEAGAPLSLIRDGSHLTSLILWGPPGTGKTTLARLVAQVAGVPFVAFSAVLSGVTGNGLSIKASARSSRLPRASLFSRWRISTWQRESSAALSSKLGFSVVAPTSVMVPFST